MSERPGPHGEPSPPKPWRLWDHIGRITGTVLGLAVLGFLLLMSFAGYRPALGLLIVAAVGVALIYFGGRLHGLGGRR